MQDFKQIMPDTLLYFIKMYEKDLDNQVLKPKITKRFLKKCLKAYFKEFEQVTILNLDTYKKILESDCVLMEKKNLKSYDKDKIGKKEVLEAYELWLFDTNINKEFELAWKNLRHGNEKNPDFEELEKIFMVANAIKFDKERGYPLSEGQENLLSNYLLCFPFENKKKLTAVKQFFTLFDFYYQNKEKAIDDLTSYDKIKEASIWFLERQREKQTTVQKGDVIKAYQRWVSNVSFIDNFFWAWNNLVNSSQSSNEPMKFYLDGDLRRIQVYMSAIFEKVYNEEELTTLEKEKVFSYWVCFQNNEQGKNLEIASQFFETFREYYLDLGLNPYSLTSFEKIQMADYWLKDEKVKIQERKRINVFE